MTLYTVSFTTKKLIRKLDKRGAVIEEIELRKPITITGLPYRTAMSFSACDNFKITREDLAHLGSRPSVKSESPRVKRVCARPAREAVTRAAETGNMAEAINA